MLTFTGDEGIRKHDSQVTPECVIVGLLNDVVLQGEGEPVHELCSGCNHIGVEMELLAYFLVVEDYLVLPFFLDLSLTLLLVFSILGRSEPS